MCPTYSTVSGFSENVLYDSGPAQEQICDEQNYACIKDDTPEKPLARKKQEKKPAHPAPYRSGSAQKQKFDEQNYACIDDSPPEKLPPRKKQEKKPARPAPYRSGPAQKQKFDEQNYACIDDNAPEKPPPRKKRDKPVCPLNNLYSTPMKKSQPDAPKSERELPISGRNTTMDLNDNETVLKSIYECDDAWDRNRYSRILSKIYLIHIQWHAYFVICRVVTTDLTMPWISSIFSSSTSLLESDF